MESANVVVGLEDVTTGELLCDIIDWEDDEIAIDRVKTPDFELDDTTVVAACKLELEAFRVVTELMTLLDSMVVAFTDTVELATVVLGVRIAW